MNLLVVAVIIVIIVLTAIKIMKPKLTICLFYATWCGYCKEYLKAGTFDIAYNRVKSNPDFKGVEFKKFNADNYKSLIKKYNIIAFPTIIAIDGEKNKLSEFTGDRDKPEDLLTFVKKCLSNK